MMMKKVIELRHQGECEDLNESNDDTISDKWLKAGVATRLLLKKHFSIVNLGCEETNPTNIHQHPHQHLQNLPSA
jgi:quercetin dioxygenase-like cupin family protein